MIEDDDLPPVPTDVHPATRTAINETLGRMQENIDDRAVSDKKAEYIRCRVLQELRWVEEDFEKLSERGKYYDCSQEAAHVRRQSAAFAQGYAQLREALS